MKKITIQDLEANKEHIQSYIVKIKLEDHAAAVLKAVEKRIDTFPYDEEESIIYNIESVIDEVKRMEWYKSKVNPNSLREVMGRLHDGETFDFLSKKYIKD